MIAAEYEATQLYTQLAESTDNKLAIAVLKDIAGEELVHAGEFLRLLHELASDEKKFYAKGAKEVEKTIEESKKNTTYRPPNKGIKLTWASPLLCLAPTQAAYS